MQQPFPFVLILDVLICAIFHSAVVDGAKKQLVLVQAIWRHGDRTPINPLPADPYNPPDSWPQGLGELWPEGIDEQFQLGDVLRRRYQVDQAYVNETYVQSEIYIRSSDYNRTLMSAYATLAGFYANAKRPASRMPGWPGSWQPVPVHTIPQDQDYLLKLSLPCKKVDELERNEVFQLPEYKSNETYYKDLFDYLNQYKMNSKVTLKSVWEAADHLRIAKNHGRQWPSFINESIFRRIDNATDIGAMYLYSNEKIQRLRGAPLLADIANRMSQKRTSLTTGANDSSYQSIRRLKMYAYSAHDVTILAVLENMGIGGIVHHRLPDLSSCLVFELYRVGEDNDRFEVSVSYRYGPNSATFDPVPLYNWCAPWSEGGCSLDEFVKKTVDKPHKDWFAECANTSGSGGGGRLSTRMSVLGALLLALVHHLLLHGRQS